MRTYSVWVAAALISCAAFNASAEAVRVVKGDTLWDYAGKYLGNPFKWPCIHSANPQLNNPDLILVDSVVNIPENGTCVGTGPCSMTNPPPQLHRKGTTHKGQNEAARAKPNTSGTNKPSVPTTTHGDTDSITEKRPHRAAQDVGLLVPGSEETTAYTSQGYVMMPVKMLVDEARRKKQRASGARVDDSHQVSGELLEQLMPKDPRTKGALQ